ncbi:flavodoxin family protein [Prauserella cavernicola]|uniref:Flavodoxin family protein n=1 Tax=Prauserella cavernicola TaxID=2800127 RepID=A0A934QW98_9PSEU|nr:flavodoxin family protein [Prauserella cavernicola]MBK1787770.1 flavodoxin family protein [Prauserella cavernicola]
MKALVVFESMFGNTEAVAREVATGLAPYCTVEVRNVDDADPVVADDVGLVVAGGPTHAFGLSRPRTRKAAADQAVGPLVSRRTGLREWLTGLAPAPHALSATFGTRTATPRWLPGSAARGAAKRLRARGYRMLAEPENFTVHGTPGPLTAGELERARRWGERLGVVWAAQVGTRR